MVAHPPGSTLTSSSPINQQIALKTVQKLGFSTAAVWNGKEALDYLLATKDRPGPDIILMDVQMPVLDGYRATHLIRQHKPYSSLPGMSRVPIVAMTASAIQGDREKCQQAGMDDYLAKPVRGRTLEQMLVKWVERRKRYAETNEALHSHITDHDSNCSEHEPPALLRSPPPAPPKSAVLYDAQMASAYNPLSNPANEGEREQQRAAAEEKAGELRNDKLLNAAETRNKLPYLRSVSSEMVPQAPAGAALTEANVGRFVSNQAEAEKVVDDAATPLERPELLLHPDSMETVPDLTQVNAPNDSLAPPSAASRPLAPGGGRGYVQRANSDRSQRTVTPSKERAAWLN